MATSGGDSGGVQGITAADSTIVIGGSQNAPTARANVGTGSGTVAAGNDARFGKIGDVAVTGTPTAGQVPVATGPTSAAWSTPPGGGGGGSGDVTGPAGAVGGNLAVFDGATGKVIKDGGPLPAAPTWTTIAGKPAVIAEGATAAAARSAIGAGTSNLALGSTSSTAMPGDTTADQIGGVPTSAGIVVVNHGSTAGTARPAGAAVVYWIGTVAPTNAAAGDLGYGW